MNLVTSNPSVTMTSVEIADMVGKRHDNVKRTIESLSEAGVISLPQIEEVKIQRERRAEMVDAFIFEGQKGKRDSLIVVAQLCPEFTAKIVDRWQELEAQQSVDPMKILNDPAAMRGLLLGYTEKVLELESTVAIQAPKVAAFDRIATFSEGTLCITDAAKHLQIQPKKLFVWLQENKWIYRRPGGSGWKAHQCKMPSLLEHKITRVERADGSEKVCEQVLVTAKGLAKLSEIFSVEEVAA